MSMEHSPARAGLLADYMTPDELAEELDRSPRTIARWARLRIGPPRTVIGRVLRRDRGLLIMTSIGRFVRH